MVCRSLKHGQIATFLRSKNSKERAYPMTSQATQALDIGGSLTKKQRQLLFLACMRADNGSRLPTSVVPVSFQRTEDAESKNDSSESDVIMLDESDMSG
jgi:hypothetical protein